MTSEDLDSLRLESGAQRSKLFFPKLDGGRGIRIERKRQALARAEQGSALRSAADWTHQCCVSFHFTPSTQADAVAQRSAIGQQMPEVSAMLEAWCSVMNCRLSAISQLCLGSDMFR